MIKPSRVRWAGHVASMGQKRNAYGVLVQKKEGKIPVGRLDIDGKIILKLILGKRGKVHLAQDWNQWQALVSMVMNLQVP
jgi:hypothetical protein